jgi:hypothetical protein
LRLLCHNLICLMQEQETLGIIPVFWTDEPKEGQKDVLPMLPPGSSNTAQLRSVQISRVWARRKDFGPSVAEKNGGVSYAPFSDSSVSAYLSSPAHAVSTNHR